MILGVDPGTAAGAFAVIGLRDKHIYCAATFEDWLQVHSLLQPFYPYVHGAVIEQITTRPGEGRGGACKFCANYGGWQALAEIVAMKVELVVPRRWQSKVGGREVKYNSKNRIEQVCREVWPDSWVWNTSSKKKLHGLTDALGIALYGHYLFSS